MSHTSHKHSIVNHFLTLKNALSLAVFIGSIYYHTSAIAFCEITREAQNYFGLTSNCIYEDHTTGAPGPCDNTVDVTLLLPVNSDMDIRHNDFQPAGTALTTFNMTAADLMQGFTGTLFRCRYLNARKIYAHFKAVNPQANIINIGDNYFSTAPAGQSTDVGVKFTAFNSSFPSTTTISDGVDYGSGGLSNGTSSATIFPGLSGDFKRSQRTSSSPQLSYSNQAYLQFVIEYYAQYNNAVSASYLRFNLHILPDHPVNRIATCGVSVNTPNVFLGVSSTLQLQEKAAAIVPFHFNYLCDGEPKSSIKVGLQPSFVTTPIISETNNIIRSNHSTSKGVGITFSDKPGNSFTPLPWVPQFTCLEAAKTNGYCSSQIAGNTGWITLPSPVSSGMTQTLYARMEKVPRASVTPGTVLADINVLVTHN